MKFKKTLLAVGTAATIAAPVAAVVACSSTEQADKAGGIWTQYGLEHDLVLSLGIAPQYHRRADLGTTHDLVNEGYLNGYAGHNTKIGNSAGDAEYFMNRNLGLHVSTPNSKPNSFFLPSVSDANSRQVDGISSDDYGDVEITGTTTSTGGVNPDAFDLSKPDSQFILNWPKQETALASKLDTIIGDNKQTYATRSSEIIKEWDARATQLKADATAMVHSPKRVLLVRGDDDASIMWSGIIPKSHASELYGLDNIGFASPTSANWKSRIKYAKGSSKTARPYLIEGVNSSRGEGVTNKIELSTAFANSADIIIYLETPKAKFNDAQHEEVKNSLKGMLADPANGQIIMSTYDDWYMPFRGAAIGANVAMDNIERDVIGNPAYTSADYTPTWAGTYNEDDLKTIYLPNGK